MFLLLNRTETTEKTIMGRLFVDGRYYCDTIENADKQIPVGYYPIRMTYSPHFEEVMPLLSNVTGRTGIRIHPGNTYRNSSGCILVGEWDAPKTRLLSSRRVFDPLCESMRVVTAHGEKIWISIADASIQKNLQDHAYDMATQNLHTSDDYTWVNIPHEVVDMLRLHGNWDVTPTWQSPR